LIVVVVVVVVVAFEIVTRTLDAFKREIKKLLRTCLSGTEKIENTFMLLHVIVHLNQIRKSTVKPSPHPCVRY
jgi:hypothetical protein